MANLWSNERKKANINLRNIEHSDLYDGNKQMDTPSEDHNISCILNFNQFDLGTVLNVVSSNGIRV